MRLLSCLCFGSLVFVCTSQLSLLFIYTFRPLIDGYKLHLALLLVAIYYSHISSELIQEELNLTIWSLD